MKLLLLFPLLLMVGCATTTRSSMQATDITPIGQRITEARNALKINNPIEADLRLAEAEKLVPLLQQKILQSTNAANDLADRLNYIEPKYSESVGLLWKWRLIAIGSWLLIVGSIAWKFRRWFGVMACVALVGCGQDMPNDCLLDAINFNQALQSRERLTKGYVWNDILVVKYLDENGSLRGHCYSVFTWEGKIWAWDQQGSRVVTNAIPHDMGKELWPGCLTAHWIKEQTK